MKAKDLGTPASSPADVQEPTGTSAVQGLVPKLRFPEFAVDAAWPTKVLGDEGDFLSSLTGKTAEHFGTGSASYVTYMNVFSNTFTDMTNLGAVDVRADEQQNEIRSGDLLLTISSESPEEAGMSSVVLEATPNCYLNSFCTIFRFRQESRADPRFIGYVMRQPMVRTWLGKRAQGSTRFNLSKSAFRSVPLLLPSVAEQKKIAECLSTLDELIGAESQKLDALKAHKKGLMQQLFPREGETRPRLRFPEFQDAPEWRPTKLSSEINLVSGMHLAPDQYSSAGEVPYFTGPSDFTNESGAVPKWTQRSMNVAQAADTLITVKGSGVGEVWYSTLPAVAMGRQLMAVRAKNGSSQFVYQFLLTKKARFADLGAGNLIPGLSRVDILEMEAHFPLPPEQHRIASCLSSLDDLIAAQSTRIEALKTHKQGLMQQLFPQPAETSE